MFCEFHVLPLATGSGRFPSLPYDFHLPEYRWISLKRGSADDDDDDRNGNAPLWTEISGSCRFDVSPMRFPPLPRNRGGDFTSTNFLDIHDARFHDTGFPVRATLPQDSLRICVTFAERRIEKTRRALRDSVTAWCKSNNHRGWWNSSDVGVLLQR